MRVKRKVRERNRLLQSSEEDEQQAKSPERVDPQPKTRQKRKIKKKSRPYIESEDSVSDKETLAEKKKVAIEEVDELEDDDDEPKRPLPDRTWKKTTIGKVPKLDKNGNLVKKNKKKVNYQLQEKTKANNVEQAQEPPSTPIRNNNHPVHSRDPESSAAANQTGEKRVRQYCEEFAASASTQALSNKEWREGIAEVQSLIVPNARTSSGLTSEEATVFLAAFLVYLSKEERSFLFSRRPTDGNTVEGEVEGSMEEAGDKRKSVKHTKSPSKKRRRQ
jgi:hypothetical protein